MKYFKTALLVSSVALFTACGGSSSSSSDGGNIDYSGTYDLFVESTTSTGTNGSPCGNASGTMNISNSDISGEATSVWGDVFDLSGEISLNGYVSGGFFIVDYEAGSFEGQAHASGGSGTWEDALGCSGTWTVQKNKI